MGQLTEDSTLRNRIAVFADRSDAGRRLAALLSGNVPADTLVLAIPAGGVPVGAGIAAALNLTLDVVIVRKIQLPDNTEAGFGAVGPQGERMINERMARSLGFSAAVIEQQVQKALRNVNDRNRLFRHGKPFPELGGRTVLLVDDGLAAGSTMTMAVRVVKAHGAAKIIIAVPTAPLHTIEELLPLADGICCLNVRDFYPFAVAAAYRSWHDVDDDEVLALLRRHGRAKPEGS